MFTVRHLLIMVVLLAAAASLAAAALPDSAITGSIAARSQELPNQGPVSQGGRVVGWATGARLKDRTVEFDAITEAKRLEPSRNLDFAGYTLSVVQVRLVRYPNEDPTAAPVFERVVAEIKSAPGN